VKSCQSFSFLVRCPSNREAQTSQNWYLKLKDSYDSFGKLTASTGSLVNPFRYTARESDTETGLYYYCARYYDPANGRFANEDRLGFDGGENFYIYTGNSPISKGLLGTGTQMPSPSPDPFSC